MRGNDNYDDGFDELYLINTETSSRLRPNGDPTPIENDLFTGEILFLMRPGESESPGISFQNGNYMPEHFRSKQRRFEIQIQGRWKEIPDGQIFVGCEVKESLKLGMVQKAFIRAIMKSMHKRNSGFSYNLAGGSDNLNRETIKSGEFEYPHMAFTLEKCVDRFVATPSGEDPPQLGSEIPEDPSFERLKNGDKGVINCKDTVTIAIWSAYFDFLQWKCLNLAPIQPFPLTSIIKDQTFNFSVYTTKVRNSCHYQCDMKKVLDIELGHKGKTKLGPCAKKWTEKAKKEKKDKLPSLRLKDQYSCKSNSQASPKSANLEENPRKVSLQLNNESIEAIDAIVARDCAYEMNDNEKKQFLQNNDPITLVEFPLENVSVSLNCAGGFAVLQNQRLSNLVIEKVPVTYKKKQKEADRTPQDPHPNRIQNGDSVMIKLLHHSNANNESENSRYLAVRKGWWLKWVGHEPKTSGIFYIYKVDNDVNEGRDDDDSGTCDPYLRIGDQFCLRVRRWSRYHVGVATQCSAKFGGRVLGIVKPDEIPSDGRNNSLKTTHLESNVHSIGKRHFMKPLHLTARPSTNCSYSEPTTFNREEKLNDIKSKKLEKPSEKMFQPNGANNITIETPAWIEMMHREKRQQQRVYVVCLHCKSAPDKEEHTFLRLQTGKDISTALKESSNTSTKDVQSKVDSILSEEKVSLCFEVDDDLSIDLSLSGEMSEMSMSHDDNSSDGDRHLEASSSDENMNISPSNSNDSDICNFDSIDEEEVENDQSSKPKKWMKKSSQTIENMAKKVKKSTTQAGRAIRSKGMTVRLVKPPSKDPKMFKVTQGDASSPRRSKKDHHVAVNKTLKSIKREQRRKKRTITFKSSKHITAGQLSAPDQSCKIVSQILAEIASVFSNPSLESTSLLCSKLSPLSDLDTWFLRGGSVELGVVPRKNETNETPCGECVIARCLWESHWREEACLVYENQLDFYAPLSKRPSTTILYIDVQKVRIIDAQDNASPLANLPLMAIETAWRCHYLSFADDERRSTFHEKLNAAIYNCPQTEGAMNKDVWKAHLLQEFQSVVKYSLSEGKGKWATISSSKKSKQRVVLNNRRMAFDCELFLIDGSPKSERLVGSFVEDLLRQALSFSLETLESCPEDFIHFLDCSSRLRTLPLQKLDLSGKEALCICVNLYHCLLQHSLLLSSHGPPSKKSIGHFMRTNCYEIGGDVFSLAELHTHVIRGNMSKATIAKAPFVQPPKKSRAHLAYALSNVDSRINFVLLTGDVSQTSHVPILTPKTLDDRLNQCSKIFLRKQISVDLTKKTVILPKLYRTYRFDFGNGEISFFIRFCLPYLDCNTRSTLLSLLKAKTLNKTYQQGCDGFHSSLKLMVDWNEVAHRT